MNSDLGSLVQSVMAMIPHKYLRVNHSAFDPDVWQAGDEAVGDTEAGGDSISAESQIRWRWVRGEDGQMVCVLSFYHLLSLGSHRLDSTRPLRFPFLDTSIELSTDKMVGRILDSRCRRETV